MNLRYRPLGRTGVLVSELVLGTVDFGPRGSLDAASCREIVDCALDRGINMIDTADIYSQGVSEEMVGRALEGRRGQVLIATKAHGRTGSGVNDRGSSRLHLMQAVEASLRRLRTDWIDLYQLHLPDDATPLEETLHALDDLVRQGKVRYVGTSNFPAWQLVEALWVSDRHHLVRIASEQPRYSLLDRRIEREILPACRHHGIAILPWGPLAGGDLTGKYRLGAPLPPDSRRARHGQDPSSPAWLRRLQVVESLLELATEAELPLAQFALLWLLQQDGVTAPIVGARSVRQLEESLYALDRRLPDGLARKAGDLTAEFA